MNILYHHRTQAEGVERVHIMGIVNAWRSMGHHVEIVSPPGVEIGQKPISKNRKRKRWKHLTRILPEIVFEIMEFFYNGWATFTLLQKMRSKKYDLLFERYSFMCFSGMLCARRCNGIPFFLEVNYTSRTPIVRKRTFLFKPLDRFIESYIFHNADCIVVVSSYLKYQLMTLGIPKEKLLMLPNAADPKKFDPNLKSDEIAHKLNVKGKKVVGFVGYFYPWHGIEHLVNSYEYVSTRLANVVYLLVGDGPIREKVLEVIRKKGYEDVIRLVGSIRHEEVPKYISIFDVAVMPHSNVYGSPMKVLEYMAMGKAVIAPRLLPLKDIITEGRDGILFEPRDEKEMAKSIVRLLSDDDLRIAIGRAARQKIVQRHNWQNNAAEILRSHLAIERKREPGSS